MKVGSIGGEPVSVPLQVLLLMTSITLLPAALLGITAFTRIIIVLGLLRQALGTGQTPGNQVLLALALFLTAMVMMPVFDQAWSAGIAPYLDGQITQQEAMDRGVVPLREFMIDQIQAAGNDETVLMFHEFSRQGAPEPERELVWGDFSTTTLIPAFVLSELKVAFLMGFKIYLPFLIVDMVISAVLISMGMMMLPPVMISLPFKLLLFVLVDGWHLITQGLMGSFAVT